MLRYILALVLASACAGTASASDWAEKMFDEFSRDFGAVPRGPTLVHPFRVVNKSNSTVRIGNIRPSCANCTTAKALQTQLAPGQETAIIVEMDTRKFTGPKTVTIYVAFHSGLRMEEVRLVAQANSRDDVSVLPETLSFGKIKRGTSAVVESTVTFLGQQVWQVTAVTSESNYIQPQCELLPGGPGETLFKLSAALRADAPAGKWFTDVWVHTNNPASPKIRVPLMVEIEAPLSISPAMVSLGEVKAGKFAEPKKLVVRSAQPFRVVGFQGTDGQLSISDSTSESKAVHVLTVNFNPQQLGPFARTLRVVTDLPGEESVEFTTMAQVVK